MVFLFLFLFLPTSLPPFQLHGNSVSNIILGTCWFRLLGFINWFGWFHSSKEKDWTGSHFVYKVTIFLVKLTNELQNRKWSEAALLVWGPSGQPPLESLQWSRRLMGCHSIPMVDSLFNPGEAQGDSQDCTKGNPSLTNRKSGEPAFKPLKTQV